MPWDITNGEPHKLLLFLKVIEETYDDLERQGVGPDMVFTFHGPLIAEFEYRFNRRYRLSDMIERLMYVGLRTPPMPYRLLRLAEDHG